MIHSLIQAVRDFVTAPRRLREAEKRAEAMSRSATRWMGHWADESRAHKATHEEFDAYRRAVQTQDTPADDDEMERLVAELGIETHTIPLDRKYDFRAVSKIDGDVLDHVEAGKLGDLKSFEARWAGDANVSVEWREAS